MNLPVPLTSRPAVLEQDGIKHMIYVHDQFYRTEVKKWRQRIASVHPDKIRSLNPTKKRISSKPFRIMQSAYRSWLRKERTFYWQFRLMPPDWRGPVRAPQKLMRWAGPSKMLGGTTMKN